MKVCRTNCIGRAISAAALVLAFSLGQESPPGQEADAPVSSETLVQGEGALRAVTPPASAWPTTASAAQVPPPLGLGDVEDLLLRAQAQLASASTTPTLAAQAEAALCIERAGAYLDRLARASRGRIAYRWVSVGKRKRLKEAGPIHDREYPASSPVAGVWAVRFQAIDADIYVESLIVRLPDGREESFRIERWIHADLPKREQFEFTEPKRVRGFVVLARHEAARRPRLTLEAGVAERPDYAREGASHCTRALAGLREGRWEATRAELASACEKLRALRAQRVATPD